MVRGNGQALDPEAMERGLAGRWCIINDFLRKGGQLTSSKEEEGMG